ncbi:MAG: adenylate cyclase [Chloroflexota bacterium]
MMFKSKYRFAKVSLVLLLTVLMVLVPLSTVFAAGPTTTAGQPNQSCEDAGSVTPGHSASATGSAFNPNGKAGTVYAGEQPQNSVNPHSVSQYDVACFQVSQH